MSSLEVMSEHASPVIPDKPLQLLQHDLMPDQLLRIGYDALQKGIRYPGINPNVSMQSIQSPERRWHEVDFDARSDGIRVTTGKLGALTQILDPRTDRPVTPGYHRLRELNHQHALFTLSSCLYEIIAEPTPYQNSNKKHLSRTDRPHSLRDYPEFMFSQNLMVIPVGQEVDLTNHHKTSTVLDEDLFGLEKPVDKLALAGTKLFESTLRNIVRFAASDKSTMAQLKDPGAVVILPTIETPELTAVLRFNTFENGDNIIHLAGLDGKSGFILIQDSFGAVTLMDSSFNKVLGRDDPEYTTYLTSMEKYLTKYFAAIDIKNSTTALSGDSLFDIRKQLGQMSTRTARKTLKLATE